MAGPIQKLTASAQRDAARESVFEIMQELVGYAMGGGLAAAELHSMLDRAMVLTAQTDLQSDGDLTHNRIAIRTGIERKKVGRIFGELRRSKKPHDVHARSVAKDVLAGWYSDAQFLTSDGEPKILPKSGVGLTFRDLTKKYGGDNSAVAILQELKDVDAVEVNGKNVCPKRRDFIPSPASIEQLIVGGSTVADLLKTISYNTHVARDSAAGIYQRRTTAVISQSQAIEMRGLIKRLMEECLTIIDAQITSMSANLVDGEPVQRIGVGVYQIVDE